MPPTDEKHNTTDSSTTNEKTATETNSQPGSAQRQGVPATPTTPEPTGDDRKAEGAVTGEGA